MPLQRLARVRATVKVNAGQGLAAFGAGLGFVVSCYEAGYDGFWLHRRLVAAGITNYVLDPSSVAMDQRARRVKTDRIDGEKMLRTLMAYFAR